MDIPMSGWRKIYLFYGIVFFALGLLGFLSNTRFSLPKLAQLTVDSFSRELEDIILLNSGESREATTSIPVARRVALIRLERGGAPGCQELMEQIQFRIGEKFQLTFHPVPGGEWYKSSQTRKLLNGDEYLIGLDLGTNRESPGVFFSLSRAAAAEFFDRLVNYRPEFPKFQLELVLREQNSLYRLSFRDTPFNPDHLLKFTDLLLDLWETTDGNLQRGSFRDTF